ncbi:HIPL1 protein-like isoform X1 [Mercurialis annua]|uniref:HIPL1 protein-like isoform X1 n=1 Tax=Mercurialis annua TaxID=3986 RepID=UPI00215F7A99|nr:HIPL1 protein-like isoform X1 [Mercurialis annua]
MNTFISITIFLVFYLLMLTDYAFSYPLCTNLRAPFTPKTSLSFCQYNGSVCCNSTDDQQLQKKFKALKVSSPGCASILKSILCSRCDPFSAELYRVESVPRAVPVLCNSTLSANSTQSPVAAVDFCSKVWDQCQNVTISNSPFALQGKDGSVANSSSKLTDMWQSKTAFCNEFGGMSDDGSVCFDGKPISLNSSRALNPPPNGICLEKIGNGSFLNMVPHPDGSNRVFLANQQGKIWLATIPEEGSGEQLTLDESKPFLDLTDEVYYDAEFGMMGLAFHPNFQQNGRFFVSFNCDKVKWTQCSGRCSCNSDVGCDPAQLAPDNGAQPCQYHSVIAEFTANGTISQPSSFTTIHPAEVRRIFTIGLPFTSHHGGQILFGPEDGYLYFMMGDGGNVGDPYNFAQNKKSLLGKIMRLDIDNIPSAQTIANLDLWGNYSVPGDNPYIEDKDLQPEIWALGFRNPWRCSFDAERSSYFLCADVGQDQFEEVDIVTKGGNYGWRIYEGRSLYNPPSFPGGNTSASSINPIFPVMGYNHSDVNRVEGYASITGGYFYRSMTDPCMYGRYLYADLYEGAVWAGTESPGDSGNFTSTSLPVKCTNDSPIPCTIAAGNTTATPALGFTFSFGQDNRKDVYILTSSGVYRIARPSRCNFVCSKENITASPPSSGPSSPSSPSGAEQLGNPLAELLLFFSFSLLLYLNI